MNIQLKNMLAIIQKKKFFEKGLDVFARIWSFIDRVVSCNGDSSSLMKIVKNLIMFLS